MSENDPDLASRAYRTSVRATNKVSIFVWILFVLMLTSWIADKIG